MKDAYKNTCEVNGELVGYLYNEISASERDRVDEHLLTCASCTDEFASLSFSRYSVFEWYKEEFATLATPRIVIPYAKQVERYGWFAGVQRAFAWNWPAVSLTAAAVLVSIGIASAVLISRSGTPDLASTNTNTIEIPSVPVAVTPRLDPMIAKDAPEIAKPVTPVMRRIKASVPRRTSRSLTAVAPLRPRSNEVREPQRPMLNTSAEADEDDKSLRLADLFDSDDTRL